MSQSRVSLEARILKPFEEKFCSQTSPRKCCEISWEQSWRIIEMFFQTFTWPWQPGFWCFYFPSVQSRLTLCDPMDCSTPGFPVHHQLPEPTQTHAHHVSDASQPSHPLLSPSAPTFSLPSIRVFSYESVLRIRWPNYWSFNFCISPSKEHSRLISFRMDWLDLLAVQGTFKSLLQHHSSKASILWCSAFFIVQLSHPYMTTGKPYLWLDRPLLAK